jgi:hypothetical protein
MSWLGDKVTKAVANAQSGNHRDSTAAKVANAALADAADALTPSTPPEGGYATFTGDEKPKRRWGR